MGIVRVLDYVDHCYNSEDGKIIHDVIEAQLKNNEPLLVSFSGVDSVPSSFVNTALVSLLDRYDFGQIKQLLRFADTTSQINDMIRSRFNFEANRMAKSHG
jgi:hypothetical protein